MKKMIRLLLFVLIFAFTWLHDAYAQMTKAKMDVIADIDAHSETYHKIAHEIWGLAELGFLEEESTRLLSDPLIEEGFNVDLGVAGMPTAFVAEWGNGKPIVAFLAEYDALPGMAQALHGWNPG